MSHNKEKDIMHETPKAFVLKEKSAYTVYRIGLTHSTSDSSYKLNADGLSIAIARCNYLAKRSVCPYHKTPDQYCVACTGGYQ